MGDSPERFLVTGAHGCIGAWTVRQLVAEGVPVIALDASEAAYRLELLLEEDALERLERVRVDITDLDAFERVLDEHTITNVIHLAALQIPFARADPALGARVNVVGTVNVFEAAARRGERMAPVVYASSIAALKESTLYGVWKRANEGTAAVFAADRGLPSVGLRPHTVYGVGRDQGLTAAPTHAMLAAVAGQPYEIGFGGRFQLQYAPDVARAFVQASRAAVAGAEVHNLGGSVVSAAEVAEAIERAVPGAAIAYGEDPLPFPAELDPASLHAAIGPVAETPLEEGVADTVARLRALLERGLVTPPAGGA